MFALWLNLNASHGLMEPHVHATQTLFYFFSASVKSIYPFAISG